MSRTLEERFWAGVDRHGPDDCWPWLRYVDACGYGRLSIQSVQHSAAHISLELDGRPRVEGAYALHSCDNPSCVNPKHLRWGDQLENMADMVDRRRHKCHSTNDHISRGEDHYLRQRPELIRRGEACNTVRLTASAVAQIRRETGTQSAIAERYGVSRSTIARVQKRLLWKHVA